MSIRAIFGIGVLIGLLFFKKRNSTVLNLISIGLGISYSLSLFNTLVLSVTGFISFGILSLTFVIYCVIQKRWLNTVIGCSASIMVIQAIMGFPYTAELQLALIIPVICYILICTNFKKHWKEFSTSTILSSYLFSCFFGLVKSWF